MSIGLTKEELEKRNNDSLIKYIGCLQTELQMIYDGKLPLEDQAIKKELDLSCPDALKCKT
jgi:hypothetical protein